MLIKKTLSLRTIFSLTICGALILSASAAMGEGCPVSDHDTDWWQDGASGTDNPTVSPPHIPSVDGATDAAIANANAAANNSTSIGDQLSQSCSEFCAASPGCDMMHSTFYVHEELTEANDCKKQGGGWTIGIDVGEVIFGGGVGAARKAVPITVKCDITGKLHHHCHCVGETPVANFPPEGDPTAVVGAGNNLFISQGSLVCSTPTNTDGGEYNLADPVLQGF